MAKHRACSQLPASDSDLAHGVVDGHAEQKAISRRKRHAGIVAPFQGYGWAGRASPGFAPAGAGADISARLYRFPLQTACADGLSLTSNGMLTCGWSSNVMSNE